MDTTTISSVSSTSTESTTESTTITPTTAKTNKRCGPGFYRDTFGRCRRIRRPHLPYVILVIFVVMGNVINETEFFIIGNIVIMSK